MISDVMIALISFESITFLTEVRVATSQFVDSTLEFAHPFFYEVNYKSIDEFVSQLSVADAYLIVDKRKALFLLKWVHKLDGFGVGERDELLRKSVAHLELSKHLD